MSESRRLFDELTRALAREGRWPDAETAVLANNVLDWIVRDADFASPAGVPTLRAMSRAMYRILEDGKTDRIRRALEAADMRFGAIHPSVPALGTLREYIARCDRERHTPDGAAVRYVNALARSGLSACVPRVTNELAAGIARALRKGRGQYVRGVPDKHSTLAAHLSALLGEDVSAPMVEKALKRVRKQKRTQ